MAVEPLLRRVSIRTDSFGPVPAIERTATGKWASTVLLLLGVKPISAKLHWSNDSPLTLAVTLIICVPLGWSVKLIGLTVRFAAAVPVIETLHSTA